MSDRYVFSRSCVLWLVLLSGGLFLLCISLPAAAQPDDDPDVVTLVLSTRQINDSFVPAHNQIGLIPKRGLDENTARELGLPHGAMFLQNYPGGISVYEFSGDKARKEIFQIAHSIRQSSDVAHAGLVLYPVGSTLPVVITDRLVVLFRKGTPDASVQSFADSLDLTHVMQMPRIDDLRLFRLKETSSREILEVTELAMNNGDVVVAHPQLFAVAESRQSVSTHQWHHLNIGQAGRGPTPAGAGAVDSDIDSDLAWDITEGSSSIRIAVLDDSFDVNANSEPGHPDYLLNLWSNPDESGSNADNGIDDPPGNGNGYVDDVHGYNFAGCEDPPGLPCGSGAIAKISNEPNRLKQENGHGTAVAGLIAGSSSGPPGFKGACPDCSLILLQRGFAGGPWAQGQAITYATEVEAHILNNSWGLANISVPVEVELPIQDAVQSGMTIFWAMENRNRDRCVDSTDSQGNTIYTDVSADENVIAISAISNQERKVTRSGFGECMELLAPSHGGYGTSSVAYSGSLNIATTDRNGPGDFIDLGSSTGANAGYNDEYFPFSDPLHGKYAPDYCPVEIATSPGHTLCFGGTSASAPIAAGTAGLVLSADPSLDPIQVQRLLQDTADKVEDSNPDPAATLTTGTYYLPENGKSRESTHGYGRINAYEAVRVVAPTADGGLGGTDIFVRDNRLDWGNTSQMEDSALPGSKGSNVLMDPVRGYIAHYRSVDIKVDVGNSQSAPTDSLQFDALNHLNPVSGSNNQVYVRVHNRGPQPASDVEVKLYLVWAGPALPALPGGFWPTPPDADVNEWMWLGTETIESLPYSGASVAGTIDDESAIVSFEFTGPALDPSLPGFRHFCLFAIISSPDDPVSVDHIPAGLRHVPDIVTPMTNNVTHRNVALQDPATSGSGMGMMIRNPFEQPMTMRLVPFKPNHWELEVSEFGFEQPFELDAGKEVPVMVKIIPDDQNTKGEVEIRQEILIREEFLPLGGFVIEHNPG